MLFPSTPLSTWCDPGINGTLKSNNSLCLTHTHTHSVGGGGGGGDGVGWAEATRVRGTKDRVMSWSLWRHAETGSVEARHGRTAIHTHTRRAASPHKAHPFTAVQTGPCWKLGASGLVSFNWSSNAYSSPFPTAALELELGGGGEAITGTADRYRSILTAFTAAVMDTPPPPPLQTLSILMGSCNLSSQQRMYAAKLRRASQFYLPIPVAPE